MVKSSLHQLIKYSSNFFIHQAKLGISKWHFIFQKDEKMVMGTLKAVATKWQGNKKQEKFEQHLTFE